MNLRMATKFLIIGSAYTLFYKAVFAIFPFITNNILVSKLLSLLWIMATITIILFAYYFPKEVFPLNKRIKISLQLVILFTCLIILLQLPFGQSLVPGMHKNVIFEFIRFLNSISMFVFWISFYKILSHNNSLQLSLKLVIWTASFGLFLELIQFYYYINFLFTGSESIPFAPLQYFAAIIFVLSYCAVINFLLKFRKVEDYSELLLK
ncbi:MAG: hypothetical protein C4539_07335 [Ignavibacteriales bacterium]|nr:MAG: hypothetical protein C4539_07335 [Ignavibacteriales bacterium]